MTTAIAAIVALIVLLVGILWHVVSEAQRHERVSAQYQTRLRRCQDQIDSQRDEIGRTQTEVGRVLALLIAAELERDVRRPGSPISAYLARRGSATTGELTTHFGPDVAPKLVELMERQEVICQAGSGRWRWVPPIERVLGQQIDLTATIEPIGWSATIRQLPTPRDRRALLEVV